MNNPNYRHVSPRTKSILKTLGVTEQLLKGEAIAAIEDLDKGNVYPRGSFHLGNVLKYLWRIDSAKGEPIADLVKAKDYLARYYEISKKLPWYRRLFSKKAEALFVAIRAINELIETIPQTVSEIEKDLKSFD